MESKELLTKRKIEALAARYENTDPVIREIFDQNAKSFDVLVSHSSSDIKFIKKVLLFLKYSKGGIRGYVDWQDPTLPPITDAITAQRLKERIKRARKVIYVVTNESLKSVWCSWEIGFADSAKGINDIAILAIKPNNGRWKNNEFLQQYPWISYDMKSDLFLVNQVYGYSVKLNECFSNKFNTIICSN